MKHGQAATSARSRLRELRNIEATDFALTLVIEAGETHRRSITATTPRNSMKSRVAALHRAMSACLDGFVANADAPLGTISISPPTTAALAFQRDGASDGSDVERAAAASPVRAQASSARRMRSRSNSSTRNGARSR